MTALSTSVNVPVELLPVPRQLPVPDPVGDTLIHEDMAEALNALLADTEVQEGRLPMALNGHGQWCTKGVWGWRVHPSYEAAYRVAHGEEVA